jgi:hypothetical protein
MPEASIIFSSFGLNNYKTLGNRRWLLERVAKVLLFYYNLFIYLFIYLLFVYFEVLVFKLTAYTLSHSTTPFCDDVAFEIGSRQLFSQAGIELQSSSSLPPE